MKKSNIILTSILGIFLILIVVIHIHLKFASSTIEDTTVELNCNNFNSMQIGSGWYINMVEGKKNKISIPNDSIKKFISSEGNTLKLKDMGTVKDRIHIDITNTTIQKLDISGNSYLKYESNFIDSIYINQSGTSRINLRHKDDNQAKADVEIKQGQINYASVILTDNSRLELYYNLKTLTGKLENSCNLIISEEVFFKDFSKSKESNLDTW